MPSWTFCCRNSLQSVPWADATRTYGPATTGATSHEKGHPFQPRVTIAYFFTSHDHIHHVRVFLGTLPLLLFSDPHRTRVFCDSRKENRKQALETIVPSETEFAWLPSTLHGPFAVMSYVGEETVNIWP